jgi:anti-sigma regulatory factor (Ser/Thr protein kinase)
MAANLSLELDRGRRAPQQARRALEALNGEIPRPVLPDARLLVSELVTNSVKYGGLGPVRLELSVSDARLRAEVVDQGKGFKPKQRSGGLEEVGGWGLPLVEHLADRWGTFEGSTHVWFEIELG